ncbi:hypothetical protein MYCTH_2298852 [Thermothelomyces thermophilus ATCC 42464]|uniref:Uncharacterized protein n=1 Tax=Thermothelomyces thermophilus (strain ATCC 42464 / BCRC 31852 / DSM 1799) TaxID=573729 RepID=G2Q3G7_THET4|nr:uncharacterized protein MYCTH_2298852 [Thermothelomyces thermophilus ATCC 42464]AEO55227.1 hypothetical protein MYCTH_2298852 [Thermothelomyces thermophilus ATCC 42464]
MACRKKGEGPVVVAVLRGRVSPGGVLGVVVVVVVALVVHGLVAIAGGRAEERSHTDGAKTARLTRACREDAR